jgi:hypothetical protein
MAKPNNPVSGMIIIPKNVNCREDIPAVLFIPGPCLHCHKPFGDEKALALAAPYFACIHYKCAPLFKFDSTYPHPKPMCDYQ